MTPKNIAYSLVLAAAVFLVVRYSFRPGHGDLDNRSTLAHDASKGVSLPSPSLPEPDRPSSHRQRLAEARAEPEADSAPSPDPPSLPDRTQQEEEEQFKWLRATTEAEELRREFAAIEASLHEACRDEVYRRLAAGEYEALPPNDTGNGGIVSPGRERRFAVDYYAKDPDGKPVRITLPEKEFPEAYGIKRRMCWLDDLIRSASSKATGGGH